MNSVLAGYVKLAGATALFGLAHSALASRQAKAAAAVLFGRRNRNGLYRLFYIAQSFVTLGALAVYARRLPDRVLYQARGRLARAMRLGQALALLYAAAAARQVGLWRITGLASAAAWLRGEAAVPAEPEAQGPAPDATGQLRAGGPFAWSRHPPQPGPRADHLALAPDDGQARDLQPDLHAVPGAWVAP